MKKRITLLLIFVTTIFSLVYIWNSFKVSSYNSKIDLSTYFSLDKGYTYNSNDSIFISKFSKPNEQFLIIDYVNGDTLSIKTNNKSEDLRKYKFVDLYKRKTTDTIPPLKKGIYILQLGEGEEVFRDMVFVNDESQKDYDGRTALHLASSEGHTHIVNFLINIVKVNKNPIDRWDNKPIDDAVKNNFTEIIEMLSVF